MQAWTVSELMMLTRMELCNLAVETELTLYGLDAGSIGRLDAITTLENIRRVMLMRGFHF
ncbi:hypothetical protein [Bradyrhizobium iriomotense]|uniref:Uncharacterized protein n=1 Tax=Bradyrhizobium iriomotense TaxID=441950 RepID=A0ABQ6AWG1_9BRAD|nr:hypothetical protein [Bradyrhizobium iriomotense]GLR86519.1 hypothetical protein GCM10007857_32300 [Bradyrhizobium iriomotense]